MFIIKLFMHIYNLTKELHSSLVRDAIFCLRHMTQCSVIELDVYDQVEQQLLVFDRFKTLNRHIDR